MPDSPNALSVRLFAHDGRQFQSALHFGQSMGRGTPHDSLCSLRCETWLIERNRAETVRHLGWRVPVRVLCTGRGNLALHPSQSPHQRAQH